MFLNCAPQFLFQCSDSSGFFNESSNLSPCSIMDDYGRDAKYSHFICNVTILVEINYLDVKSGIVYRAEEFHYVGKLSSTFSIPFSGEHNEKVAVHKA